MLIRYNHGKTSFTKHDISWHNLFIELFFKNITNVIPLLTNPKFHLIIY
jgi:hypothetical protein